MIKAAMQKCHFNEFKNSQTA